MDGTAVTTSRTAGKGGESLPGSMRGGGAGRASQEELMKGVENAVCMQPARPLCRYCVFVS